MVGHIKFFLWGGGGAWSAAQARSPEGTRETSQNKGSELSNATIGPQSDVVAEVTRGEDEVNLTPANALGTATPEGVPVCDWSTGATAEQHSHTWAQHPMVRWHSRDHPANHPPPRERHPRGKNGRFRQQSGSVSGKYSLFQLIICVFELSQNPSSPVYGNTVVTAVTLANGGNGSKIAYFAHSAGTAPGAPPQYQSGPTACGQWLQLARCRRCPEVPQSSGAWPTVWLTRSTANNEWPSDGGFHVVCW